MKTFALPLDVAITLEGLARRGLALVPNLATARLGPWISRAITFHRRTTMMLLSAAAWDFRVGPEEFVDRRLLKLS